VQAAKTGVILGFELLRRAGNSVVMEKEGCLKMLRRLTSETNISAFCTDRSTSVRALMRTTFPDIIHQFDPWHISKGIMKALKKSAKLKKYRIIGIWINNITNHLWYCAQICNGDPEILLKNWKGCLKHVCNIHEWIDEETGEHMKCNHGDLKEQESEILWFQEGSAAHEELKGILLKPKLLQDIRFLSMFIHTSLLENFHSCILKYAPKRLFFRKDSMLARTELAVIDHNRNLNREELKRYPIFNKKTTGRMGWKIVKGEKDDDWKFEIRRMCLSSWRKKK
jgi:hypothetical protein